MRAIIALGRIIYLAGRNLLLTALWVGILGCCFAIGFMYAVVQEMPLLESLSVPKPALSSELFANDGASSLGHVYQDENRVLVTSEQIPKDLKNAFVAIEDRSFYFHAGIDPRGIGRAALSNLTEGDLTGQGGSTITQQLVRNLYLSRQKKFMRKLQEIIIALRIEKKYSKDEILTFYMNEVYLGAGAYGVEAAAQTYFGKPVDKLTLPEAALIAGMPQRPSTTDPFQNPEAALSRRNLVLTKMEEQGFITPEEADAAKEAEVVTAPRATGTGYKGLRHPWFGKQALDEAAQLLGPDGRRLVYFGGLRIYTTLDPRLQTAAEEAVAVWLPKWERQRIEQAALVAIDPRTGRVVALVGGKDFTDNEFNRVTQAKRQPGSSFKPFVYLAALQAGYSPMSLTQDVPRTFVDDIGREYTPRNYDGSFMGTITMKKALEMSRNVVAVTACDLVGPKAVIEAAQLAGIHAELNPYLSLALGSGEVTLLDQTVAYATFASRGVYHKPYFVETITDSRGRVLFQQHPQGERVFDANTVDMLNYMLQGVMVQGTGARARLDRPCAGKTGTTSDYVDAWFLGYTPDLVAGAWCGRDDNTPMARGVTGGHFPAYIWRDFMQQALAGSPATKFPQPNLPRIAQALDAELGQADLLMRQEAEAAAAAGELPPSIDPESGQPETPPQDKDGDGRPDPPPIFF